jgi:hypothetical protein
MVSDSWLEECLDCVGHICKEIDLLSNPNIEEKMHCDLACCFGDVPERDFLDYYLPVVEDHLGNDFLQLLQEYEERLARFTNSCEKGFSKTQEWFDFVVFINKVQAFLKDVLLKHGRVLVEEL